MSSVTSRASRRSHPTRFPARPGEGVAALTMVMVLFFVMAMVAAYTNRNLIYEQRVSVNNYRATAAMSAADAGIDWAVAMLSGGRIDTNCVASVDPLDDDFRSRYLLLQPDGSYASPTWFDPAFGFNRPAVSACVLSDAGWNCSCTNGSAASLPFVAGTAPVFRVEVLGGGGTPGVVVVRSRGCSNFGIDPSVLANPNVATACHRAYGSVRPRVDGVADLQVSLGLARALPVPPVAALTAGDTISMAGATLLTAVNSDSQTGVTIHSGKPLPLGTNVALTGPPGSNAPTQVTGDAALDALLTPAAGEPGMFESMFGMDAATFSRQPAAVWVDCTGGCTAASIAAQLANHRRRILWINGNINLDQAGAIGTANQPVMLIASGDITLSAAVNLTGFIYGRDILWQPGAAGAAIVGAAVASRNFQGAAPVTVAYDANVLQRISRSYGSFVRVPGSWQTTPLQ